MILKIIEGSGLRGCLEYIGGKGSQGQLLGGSVMGTSIRLIAAEFGLIRALAPRLQRAARHLVVSLDEHDRRLDPTQMLEMARQVVRGLGYEQSPWVGFLHFDGHVQHLHIATCPIRYDGHRVREWGNYYRAGEVQQKLEQYWDLTLAPRLRMDDPRIQSLGRYGLGVNPNGSPKLPPAGKVKASHLTEREVKGIPQGRLSQPHAATQSLERNELSKRQLIREAMEALLPSVGSLGELQLGLKAYGIDLVANLEKGQLKFLLGGSRGAIFASKLDPRYTLRGLERLGLMIQPHGPIPTVSLQVAAKPRQEPGLPPPGRYRLDMGPARSVHVVTSMRNPRVAEDLPTPGRLDMGPARKVQVVSAFHLSTDELVLELRKSRWKAEMEAYERRQRALNPLERLVDPLESLHPEQPELPEIHLPSPGELVLELTADALLPPAGRYHLAQRVAPPPLPSFGKLGPSLKHDVPQLHLQPPYRLGYRR